ncbi:MAG: hypothetical protein IPO82_07990 [Betaproteobacteria bacterium]|nr:hypothetical protein [Betaproteobacteria bacterium]
MNATLDAVDTLWTLPESELELGAGVLVAAKLQAAAALAASIVCPVPGTLPRRTPVRHIDCSAVIRCTNGTVWGLRARGNPWTDAQLAVAAEVLAAVAIGTPTDELALRVGHALDLRLSLDDPLGESLDAFWAPRRIAGMVLLGLDRPAGISDAVHGRALARQQQLLERGIRAAIVREWQCFCLGLDAQALARVGAGGGATYNFLVAGSTAQRRARRDLAHTFPLLLPCAVADAAPAPGATVRRVAESGAPFVRTLARALHIRPVVIRSLVGVTPELAGPAWSHRPRALLTLLDALRAEDLPRRDEPRAWAGFNRAVALAERLFRRAPWTSTLALSWLRDAARGQWRRLEVTAAESAQLQDRGAAIDAFRDAAAVALQGLIEDRGAPADRSPAATQAVLDRHLAALPPAALLRLADRFERALAEARVELADAAGRLAGDVFASLLPSDHVSRSGRRRVAALVTRHALQAHGRALDICLADSHVAHYAAQCADGRTFVLGFYDTGTGAPCATAELRARRDRASACHRIEVRQFTGRGNARASAHCRAALEEVLVATQTPAMQEHLDRTLLAALQRRRLGKDAAARQARLLPLAQALRRTVGEPQVGRLVTEALDATAEPAVAPSR